MVVYGYIFPAPRFQYNTTYSNNIHSGTTNNYFGISKYLENLHCEKFLRIEFTHTNTRTYSSIYMFSFFFFTILFTILRASHAHRRRRRRRRVGRSVYNSRNHASQLHHCAQQYTTVAATGVRCRFLPVVSRYIRD